MQGIGYTADNDLRSLATWGSHSQPWAGGTIRGDGVTGVQELASLMAAGAIAGLSGWGWSLVTAAVRDVIQGQEAD